MDDPLFHRAFFDNAEDNMRGLAGNAAQLYKLVHTHGYAQTRAVVHGGSKDKEPTPGAALLPPVRRRPRAIA